MAKKRRKHSPEFKSAAVKLVKERQAGTSVADIARNIDVADSCLHLWVKQHDIDAGNGGTGALTTAERQELVLLRRELREVRMERDFLKKTAAFFAKESM